MSAQQYLSPLHHSTAYSVNKNLIIKYKNKAKKWIQTWWELYQCFQFRFADTAGAKLRHQTCLGCALFSQRPVQRERKADSLAVPRSCQLHVCLSIHPPLIELHTTTIFQRLTPSRLMCLLLGVTGLLRSSVLTSQSKCSCHCTTISAEWML